ncbi:Leucyl aminopeptidase yscIV [Umbelopsis sp. WA50703]
MCGIREPNTLSNIDQVKTTHLHLDWTISFDKNILSGHAILDLITLVDQVEKVVLDTSFLDVTKATFDGKDAKFSMGDRQGTFGSALTVTLPTAIEKAGTSFKLRVDYSTTEKCTAIQYLKPSQTEGKKHPYLFSQCEPIHARALTPCQDSPSIKLTYSANVTSPLQVVMSALHTGVKDNGNGQKTYSFEQRTTIPSYLIAIAAGNLVGREIGPRSTVWCEPEVIDSAAWEFTDTEKFIVTGEELLTPYEWGRYDLLVLPPSFPYGGMENPCLTFVTPTLLAGDKSAVDVVAHEIAHSWMGNLVTTESWEHFWLNEGWTVFIERKITGRMHGEAERQFSSIIGWKALKESVELFGHDSPATRLNTDLTGIDPDDYFSSIPYEKGFNLLYHIEKVVGGPKIFEPYMKAHVEKFASKTVNTEQWKAYLYEFMEKTYGQEVVDKLNTIDFELWLRGTGMPPVDPQFDTTLADACYKLADKWDQAREDKELKQFSPNDVSTFTATQKIVFLERLTDMESLPHDLLTKMDELYQLTTIRNADVRFRWQQLCLQASYERIYPEVVQFVTEQGRMKFVRPLYRLLYKAKNGADLARDTYMKHRDFYHPIAGQLIEKDIGIKQ